MYSTLRGGGFFLVPLKAYLKPQRDWLYAFCLLNLILPSDFRERLYYFYNVPLRRPLPGHNGPRLCAFLLPSVVFASPIGLHVRDAITVLSTPQVSAYKPYTYFAAVSYCEPSVTLAWSCGAKCDANSGFETTASGGDGGDTQYWYVGYDATLYSVVVGHQGTNTSNLVSVLVEADFVLGDLDSTLFPGLSSDIKVHSGFADAHARAAPSVLAAVNTTLAAHPSASVTTAGHSLGAALALLDAVFLPLHLLSCTVFKTVGYGVLRVGNQEFADYVDAHVPDLTHVNNKKDPIPGRGLGFHHPSSEVHVRDSGEWDACPGQDNTDERCTVGDVPNILESDLDDHGGPYDSVYIVCTDD